MNNNELNNQTDNLETQNTDDDSTVTDDLEDMIEQLPENFPQALPIIQNEIAPIIAECDPGLIKQKHFYSPKARPTLSAPFTAPFFLPSILRYSLRGELFSTTLPRSQE